MSSLFNFWHLFENEAETLNSLSWIMIVTGVAVFVILPFITAPYGRYFSEKWGASLPSRPAWILQELPSFVVPVHFFTLTSGHQIHNTVNQILLGLFLLHYTQRAWIFPFLIRGGKPTSVITFLVAAVFCTLNGYLQGRSLGHFSAYPDHWLRDPRFIIGVLLFGIGMSINIHSDHILRNLRQPGEKDYKIPRGGMFEYVSGANFFGEIVEWCGFALACSTLHAFAFAWFTTCNIGPRAWTHHRWYLEKFGDKYPQHRKAILPFIL